MSTAPVDFGAAARGLSKANGAALAPDVADSDSGPRPAALRCLTADEFFAAESPANLVVPALGICPGPPTGFVGQAFVGKTIVALSMGLSVATGRD